MSAKILETLVRVNHYALKTNLAGFTHEESLIQPAPAGNCANWILGHVLHSRNAIHALVGLEPAWDPQHSVRYRRGSAPVKGGGDATGFADLLGMLDRSQETLLPVLGGLGETDLEKTVGENSTLGRELTTLVFHESYHVGQTGVVRRLAGKEGAIR